MGKEIKIDDTFISGVRTQLSALRGQITSVRGGSNPNDAGHPTGWSLTSINIVPGHTNFQSGVDFKSRVTAVGSQVDTKLGGFDAELDKYAQTLGNILASSDHVELNNMSLADYGKFTGESTGAAPTTGGGQPPTIKL